VIVTKVLSGDITALLDIDIFNVWTN